MSPQSQKKQEVIQSLPLPPTWEPVADFDYNVIEISVKQIVPDNLTLKDFENVKHIADGSNSNIFIAVYKQEKVIIKMIKEQAKMHPIAIHEFDIEHGILARVSHPHIIKILGAGIEPRRFIVLEWLGGGSLNTVLHENLAKPGLANHLFHKPTFTYSNLLLKARDIADALDYLHSRCHIGACMIHRDIKPENIGFTVDGKLKLFDFGLTTCVKTRQSSNIAYEMTGHTGSLRYMAPEVALRQSYCEKVDVYSFGIMLWQMARDKIPFKGLNRDEFHDRIIQQGERPKLDKTWPIGFSQLLTKCWDKNPEYRPSFHIIIEDLNKLIKDMTTKIKNSPRNSFMKLNKAFSDETPVTKTQRSWF